LSPQSAGINQIDKLFEKITPHLPKETYSEIYNFKKIMQMDLRDASISIDMGKSFEEKSIQNFSQFCYPKEKRDMESSKASLKEALINSLNYQLNYYFILRDFSLPAINAMKARTLIHQRRIANEELPSELITEANELNTIIENRGNYQFKPQSQPFMLSESKYIFSRDIQIQNNAGENLKEDILLNNTLLTAPLKSLYGRPNDIEHLISCGVLVPEARKLANNQLDDSLNFSKSQP
jgi:hypothetical protein